MSTLAELVVKINADASGMQRGFTAAQRATQQLSDRMARLGRTMTVGITAPLALVGASFVSAASDMDALTRGLTAVTGSSQKTQQQLQRLQDVAKLPGLGFREAIQGSINLQAAGLSANTSERALRAFGNALATVGKGKADLDGVILALGQIASKGKVSAEEINQLAERVPQIRQAMQAAFGSADTEALGKAGINATRFIDGLVEQLLKLPQASGGASTAFENLSDAAFRARAAIGEQLLPAIVPLVDGLATMLSGLKNVNPETVRWGIAIAAVAAVAGPMIALTGSLASAVTSLTTALGIAGLAGTIATGGLLLVLGGLSALFVKNRLDALAAANAANEYRVSLIGLTETQLITMRTMESMRLSELHASEQALIGSGNAFRPRVNLAGLGPRGSLFGASRAVPGGETEEMHRLGTEANTAGARVASLTRALDTLHAASALVGNRTVPTATGAVKHLSDSVDQLGQKWADAAKRAGNAWKDMLAQVGAIQLGALPAGLERALRGKAIPSGIDAKVAQSIEGQKGGAGEIQATVNAFSQGVGRMLSQFGPVALAFQAINAVLQPLQPLIDALLVPFSIMGEILASSIVPVLRLLFPIIKAVAIVFSYVQEVVDRVLAAILIAVGSFVKGLGKFINAIVPFANPGNPLIKAGQAIIDTAHGFSDAAKEIAKKRKELEDLSFDDALNGAADAANKLSEALINAAQGFKIDRFRFNASTASAAASSGGGGASANITSGSMPPIVVNVNGATDPDGVAEMVVQALNRWALSSPHMRATVAGLTP